MRNDIHLRSPSKQIRMGGTIGRWSMGETSQSFEIERKYRFLSLEKARRFIRIPAFRWQKTGIIQWYLDENDEPGVSVRVRLMIESTPEGFTEQWVIGSKKPVDGNPERRVEVETTFSPENVSRDLPYITEAFRKRITSRDFDPYPVVAKIRYQLVFPAAIAQEANVVLDYFLYPKKKKGERVYLEIELKDRHPSPHHKEQFESLFQSLGLSSLARDITDKKNMTNRSLAENAFEKSDKEYRIEKGMMEIQQALRQSEYF